VALHCAGIHGLHGPISAMSWNPSTHDDKTPKRVSQLRFGVLIVTVTEIRRGLKLGAD
jgi:hypothetical protein